MRVVILAAGLGRRLGSELPKPLASVAPGVTILSSQLDVITPYVSRSDIWVVVGFKGELIRGAAAEAHFVEAGDYARSNTGRSLLAALEAKPHDENVLVLNGDLYLDRIAIEALLERSQQYSRILARFHVAGPAALDPRRIDAVRVRVGEDGFVQAIGKALPRSQCESLGAQLIQQRDLPTIAYRLAALDPDSHYESAMDRAVREDRMRLSIVDVGSHSSAMEVDTPIDLQTLRDRVAERKG